MSVIRWVQHISGQGEKWEVTDNSCSLCWHTLGGTGALHLPKSEYVLCEPPERWVDVTKDVKIVKRGMGKNSNIYIESGEFVTHAGKDLAKLLCRGEYQLRQVQAVVWSERLIETIGMPGAQVVLHEVIIIEKKEPA